MKKQYQDTQRSVSSDVLTEFRVYSVKEVAVVYYPMVSPESACRSFRKLIRGDRWLYDGLCKLGFKAHQRMLSPAQLSFLLQHLGTPGEFREIVSS